MPYALDIVLKNYFLDMRSFVVYVGNLYSLMALRCLVMVRLGVACHCLIRIDISF